MNNRTHDPLHVKPLQELLSKDMDRKEFLVHMGGVLLAVLGITGLIKKLSDPFGKSKQASGTVSSGYGSSAYGGSTGKSASV